MHDSGTKFTKGKWLWEKKETVSCYVRRRLEERRCSRSKSLWSRDDRGTSCERLSASRRSDVARHSRESDLFVSSYSVVQPCFRRSRSRYEPRRSGFLWRRLADDARPTSRRRRHAASLCAQSRLGTSHVNVVWVFTTAHTNACTLWMHGGVYKVGVVIGATRRGGS